MFRINLYVTLIAIDSVMLGIAFCYNSLEYAALNAVLIALMVTFMNRELQKVVDKDD